MYYCYNEACTNYRKKTRTYEGNNKFHFCVHCKRYNVVKSGNVYSDYRNFFINGDKLINIELDIDILKNKRLLDCGYVVKDSSTDYFLLYEDGFYLIFSGGSSSGDEFVDYSIFKTK